MSWLLLVMVLAGVATLAALVVVGWRRPAEPASEVDPLFVAGISILGASVALIATVGPMMLPMAVAGIACIVVGAHRSRTHHP